MICMYKYRYGIIITSTRQRVIGPVQSTELVNRWCYIHTSDSARQHTLVGPLQLLPSRAARQMAAAWPFYWPPLHLLGAVGTPPDVLHQRRVANSSKAHCTTKRSNKPTVPPLTQQSCDLCLLLFQNILQSFDIFCKLSSARRNERKETITQEVDCHLRSSKMDKALACNLPLTRTYIYHSNCIPLNYTTRD